MRKIWLLVTFSWVIQVVAYNGLMFNALKYQGNEFIHFFLISIVEFPAYFLAWYMMESKLGRRWSNGLCLLICGLTLSVPAFTPRSWTTLIIIMSLIGKFAISSCSMIVYQQAVELYPTSLRSQGLGLATTMASVTSIFVPYLTYLAKYGVWLPLVILGSLSIMGSVIVTWLPETLNESLPQNIEDVEFFGREKAFWSWARLGDPSSHRFSSNLIFNCRVRRKPSLRFHINVTEFIKDPIIPSDDTVVSS